MSNSYKGAVFAVFTTAFSLCITPEVKALPIREFNKLSSEDQGVFYVRKINEICDNLKSEYDGKGDRKPSDLRAAQKEYATFIYNFFNTKNDAGIRTNFIALDEFIYGEFLRNPETHVEQAMMKFIKKAFNEKLAADAARAQAQSLVVKPSPN